MVVLSAVQVLPVVVFEAAEHFASVFEPLWAVVELTAEPFSV